MKKKSTSEFLFMWKEEVIGTAIFLLCFFLALYFPAYGNLQQFSSSLFFLLLLPVLYIKFVLKKDLQDFGFNMQNNKIGFLWALAMLAVSFLIIFILMRFFQFQNHYPIQAYIGNNFWAFLFYEFVLVNYMLFLQESFFKGFFLFTLTKKIGFASFFVQAFFYIIFLLAIQPLDWKVAPFIIISLTGGIVAYKSKSFIFSYLMSLIFLIALDSYIIYLFN